MRDWKHKNYLALLTVVPELDASDWISVKNSVEELQLMTGDDTELQGKTIKELLALQEQLQSKL